MNTRTVSSPERDPHCGSPDAPVSGAPDDAPPHDAILRVAATVA